MTDARTHLSADALLDYWLRESGLAETDAAEEHLMRCDTCGEALDELIALGEGVRSAFRAGEVWVASSEAFAQRVAGEVRRMREYRLPHNGSVNCTVAPDDEVLVTRLAAPLQRVRRVDVARETSLAPDEWVRVEDLPFDPEAGELVLVANIAGIRELPEHTMRVTLLAVEGSGARELGTYTFRHRPWPGWAGQGAGD
ncbi:MAG: hypothetical protein ACYC0T_15225 [Ramlibacter sp.]